MEKSFRVAFDVDGCLIDYDDRPIHFTINILRMHQKAGNEIIVWSGGGVEYAKRWVERLKLKNVRCEDKPTVRCEDVDISYDDEEVELAKLNLRVPFEIIVNFKKKGRESHGSKD